MPEKPPGYQGSYPAHWPLDPLRPTPFEIVALILRRCSEAWECNVCPTNIQHGLLITNVFLLVANGFPFDPETCKAIALGESDNYPPRITENIHFQTLDKTLLKIYEVHAG